MSELTLNGCNERVAAGFSAVHACLADVKAELRAGSCVGAMEHVAIAEQVLTRTLVDLEAVTQAPWTAAIYLMRQGKAA